jgi:hypothetical protein
MHEVRELLEDPELADLFALNAEREFVRHPDGTRNMQVYREYYQCDDFWDIQVSIFVKCGRESLIGTASDSDRTRDITTHSYAIL